MSSYDKPDYWSQRAYKEGYPARSVYKLMEMDEKFELLRGFRKQGNVNGAPGWRILDLGAAPGSWSLYVLRKLAGKGFLTAVDLAPLAPDLDVSPFDDRNFSFLKGDITDNAVRDRVLAQGPYNLIISDVAPATTGTRMVDTLRSEALVETVIDYAELALEKGGSLVVKVFQGGSCGELLKRMKSLFNTAKSFKPKACRQESFETYYIGLSRELKK